MLTRRGSFIRHGLLPAQTVTGMLLPVYFTPRGMGNTAGQGAVMLRSEDQHGGARVQGGVVVRDQG
jgi:hypothetical protein